MKYQSKYNIDFDTVESYPTEAGDRILSICKVEFKAYEYVRDFGGTPVRIIRAKDGNRIYGDFIKPETATLFRRVAALPVDDRYTDDITEDEYYVLCDFYVSKQRFLAQIDASKCSSKLGATHFCLLDDIPVRVITLYKDKYILEVLDPKHKALFEKTIPKEEVPPTLLQNKISEEDYYETCLKLIR